MLYELCKHGSYIVCHICLKGRKIRKIASAAIKVAMISERIAGGLKRMGSNSAEVIAHNPYFKFVYKASPEVSSKGKADSIF